MTTQSGTFGASGYATLPNGVVLEERTGQAALAAEVIALDGVVPIARIDCPACELGQSISMLAALIGWSDPAHSVTSYRTPIVIEGPTYIVSTSLLDDSPVSIVVRSFRRPVQTAWRHEQPASTTNSPAEELRGITGLQPAKLAELFGVSRTTYYKWIEGATPRDVRFQHLVDVLSHVKDAQRKIPSSMDLAVWLRTPVSAGGANPLQLLEKRRFSTFRGLLVRARSTDMGLPVPMPSVIAESVDREHMKVARERISPTPRIDTDDIPGRDGDR